MQTIGRINITTDVPYIDETNVASVLRKAYIQHTINANRIEYLLRYDAGEQPLTRTKTVRSDIDCQCVDNVANEITEFWNSYMFGTPINYVQTANNDDEEISEAVKELNRQLALAGISSKTTEIGRYVTIGAVDYVYIDINEQYKPGKSFISYNVLDPTTSFVVKSSYYPDKRPMMGVTYRHDMETGNNYFTCITDDKRYEIINLHKIINGDVKQDEVWKHAERSGEKNPYGIINIVEWYRSHDRMGVWERQISEMDNLNLLISDFTNDVDQNTQAIWHGNDIEFPSEKIKLEDGTEKEVTKKPESGEWVLTYTSKDGSKPSISPLAVNYDYPGMLNNILYRRQLILQKCNVPQRNDNSGGSTGVAMSDATGWSQAETAASKQQMIVDSIKMQEAEVILAVIDKSPDIPQASPLRKLTLADIEPSIKRQKTYEMSTKVNSIATLLSHGFSLEDSLNGVPFFDDNNEVCTRSGDMVRRYQESIVNKSTGTQSEGGEGEKSPNADRTMQDLSDQISNSPMIDKTRTDK